METSIQEIGARLSAVRKRIRKAQFWRGVALWLTVALAGLAAAVIFDLAVGPSPGWVRWSVSGGWLAAILWAAFHGFSPLLRPIRLLAVARWLESRHPELEERLSTALEVVDQDESVSPWLVEELVRTAEMDAVALNPAFEVGVIAVARRWAVPALVLGGAFLLALAGWPEQTSRLVLRAVAPFSSVGNASASALRISPGDLEALEGDRIVILAGVASDFPPGIVLEFDDGRTATQTMEADGEEFRYVLEPALESFRYRVKVGFLESDIFRAKVWPLPRLVSPTVSLEYPAYSEIPPKKASLERSIEALVGTRVTLSTGLNTPVEAAWLEIAGQRLDGSVEPGADGGKVEFSWEMTSGLSATATLNLEHRLGGPREVAAFEVRSIADRDPDVVLQNPPADEVRVTPDDLIELRYQVTDDLGLAEVMIQAETQEGKDLTLPCQLPVRPPGSTDPVYRGIREFLVAELIDALGSSEGIRVRVVAEDARPAALGGPGRGVSRWLKLEIDGNAESLARQQMREEQEMARQILEKASRNAREARERMNWHRGEMEVDRLPEKSLEHFKEASEMMEDARKELGQLADRLEDGMHAKRVDELKQAASKLSLALQELESLPLQEAGEKRREKLDQARDNADEAAKQLDRIREGIDRDRRKAEDVVRLQELAARQRDLARQVEAARHRSEPEEEWQNRQREVEEKLRQQLRERGDAAAEHLKEQTETARTLAEDARAVAAAQQMLAEASGESPDADEIRQVLGMEQEVLDQEIGEALAAARNERRPSADVLPEAKNATEATSLAVREGNDEAAVSAAKQAAERLKEAAESDRQDSLPSGQSGQPEAAAELADLARRQESLAAAAEDLSRGATLQAADALRSLQAEAARNLAEEIRRLPMVDVPGSLHEAREASRKAGEGAARAAEMAGNGEWEQASRAHADAARDLSQAADLLDRAVEDLARMAGEAESRPADDSRADVPADALARAFGEASKAASASRTPEAASSARRAAETLSEAAAVARHSFRGSGGKPAVPSGRSGPGSLPDGGDYAPLPPSGVPPELVKLGVSAEDWERIRSSLAGEAGGMGGEGVPEEYRGLVKDYFQSIADAFEVDD